MHQKMIQQVGNAVLVKKKQTELEDKIEMAEKKLSSLSDYENMRLRNIKERQALLENLDFDRKKRERIALTP